MTPGVERRTPLGVLHSRLTPERRPTARHGLKDRRTGADFDLLPVDKAPGPALRQNGLNHRRHALDHRRPGPDQRPHKWIRCRHTPN